MKRYLVVKNDVPGLRIGLELKLIGSYKPDKFGIKMHIIGTDQWIAVNPCWLKRKSIIEVSK